MKEFIPLMVPNINNDDIKEVIKVLKSGMLVQGKNVEKLEFFTANFNQSKHAIAVNSGTATMHLTLLSFGVKEGDEVIVPAFSYIATANVVELVGAKPIFVDVDPFTFNIDIDKIEQVITEKTKVIIAVHEFGLPCEILKIMEIAKQYKLKVIEDAACALGAKFNNKYVGTFGDAGSFSLHPRKAITSGEGGLVITNDPILNNKIRTLRSHGYNEENGEFTEAGFNYRTTDFQAALVLNQFLRLEEQIIKKRDFAKIYNTLLSSKIQKPIEPKNFFHVYQSYHVVLENNLDRNIVINKLRENGIGTNYGAQCIPQTNFYKKKYNYNCTKKFPNALKGYNSGLVLPLYNTLNNSQIRFVCTQLNNIVNDK